MQPQVNDDIDEFDAAFDEDVTESDQFDNDEEAAEPESEAEQEPEQAEQADADDVDATDDEPLSNGEPAQQQQDSDNAPDWEQKYKSFEGRYKAEKVQFDTVRGENEQLRKRLAQLESKADVSSGDESDDKEAKGDVPSDFEDWPELQDYIDQKVSDRIQNALGEVDQRLAPVDDMLQRQEAERAAQRIREKHSDIQELVNSGQLMSWIESQPDLVKNRYIEVFERGTVDESIALLDLYKSQAGGGSSSPESNKSKARQSAAVRTKASKPIARAGKDDFDGAWDEV